MPQVHDNISHGVKNVVDTQHRLNDDEISNIHSSIEESVYPNFVVNPTIPISPFDIEEITAFFEKRKEFQFPQ